MGGVTTGAVGPLFTDVDADDPAVLIAMMAATDRWPAVGEARSWVLDITGIDRSSVVVDVGCGTGAFGSLVRARGASTVEIDRSAEMVAVASRVTPPPVVRADVARLPLGDGTASLVRCERVLQWTDDPAAALAEMVRVAAPGGWLAITDTAWSTFAMDHPDPVLAAAWSAAALRWVRHPTLALGAPRLLRDLGATEVRVRADAVLLDSWDPDGPGATAGPPGLPLRDVAAAATDPTVLRDDLADRARLARAGRFAATLTLITACGRWP